MRGESKSIVSVLRVYTADPCPEVVLTIVSSLPTFLDHFAAHVHMVAESIVQMRYPTDSVPFAIILSV